MTQEEAQLANVIYQDETIAVADVGWIYEDFEIHFCKRDIDGQYYTFAVCFTEEHFNEVANIVELDQTLWGLSDIF